MNKDVDTGEKEVTVGKKEVVEYLDSLGFKHSIKGFNFLTEAIYGRLHGKYTDGMINMYTSIGTLFETTTSKVERAMRHAIISADIHNNNGEFIARSVDKLRYK